MRTLLLVLAMLVAAAPPAAAAVPLEAGTPLTTPTGVRCANGFNVTGHLLVAPSCATLGTEIRGPGGAVVGTVTAVRQTHAVVRITNPAAWVQRPTIAGYPATVTGSAETPVGGAVCAVGRTTGVRCGTVLAKNASVNHPGGTLHGLTRTNLCAEPGDRWAPIFSGSQAQGHLLGGSGTCSIGGTSYYYPVNRILSAEGFTLVTG